MESDRRRNSEGDFERSEQFTNSNTYTTPLGFLTETYKKRQRRKLAKEQGISEDPAREQVFLTGYHGNWMTSWFRSHRKWRHFRSSITSSDEFPCGKKCLSHVDSNNDELFHRSTGEIQDGGQIDGFVLIDHVTSCSAVPSNVANNVAKDAHWFSTTVIWGAQMRFCDFSIGDATISFDSLFPTSEHLTSVIMDAVVLPNFQDVILQMTLLALRCGPLRLVRTILELGFIDVRHQFRSGLSMLHVGCISQNFDVCLFLCTLGAYRKAKDKKGHTPYELCRSKQIRKLLPFPKNKKRLSPDLSSPGHESSEPEHLPESMDIFALAVDEAQQDELQCLLQTKNFCTADFTNEDGDYLIHILTRKGLPHLASLMNLIRLQGHDVDRTNAQGMTPLMIAASEGNDVICDVLICILGAYPNLKNIQNGYSALHYAASQGQLDVACTLLKRGIDPNAETSEGLRADDLARNKQKVDCMNAVVAAQEDRRRKLTLLARQGYLGSRLLYDADLAAVDHLGDTLLMTAARHDRVDNVNIILSRKHNGIDAQNIQSGKTALSLSASLGHTETVDALLCAGANPKVLDMSACLALHQAVKSGHVTTVETLLERSSCWHELQKAVCLSPSATITHMLGDTINKRQEMLVCPALLEGAITGNVDLLFETLEEGDDINPISGEGNWPALVAAGGGRLEVMHFLAENGGNMWGTHEISKNTLLHCACENGHDAVASFLLSHYGKSGEMAARGMVNRYNASHQVALQLAANNGYKRTVHLLLDHGASTSLLNDNGQLYTCAAFQGIQLLIQEARTRHLDDVITALKHPIHPVQLLMEVYEPTTDYNLRTVKGDSPLLVACHHGNPDVVKFLLQSFPDPAIRKREVQRPNAHDGATAMHRALQGGDHVAVVRHLLAVDQTLINTHDQAGRTPLHVSCLLGRRHTAGKLTGMPGINVNARDVNNRRADDVTNSMALRHMIEAARRRQRLSISEDPYDSTAPTSPDFEDLNRRFNVMKERHAQHVNDNSAMSQ